jgi:hypothetical protein
VEHLSGTDLKARRPRPKMLDNQETNTLGVICLDVTDEEKSFIKLTIVIDLIITLLTLFVS